jgi:uncharacterized repeat protein (TIGR01451 family)
VKYGIARIENNTIDENFGPVSASAIFASRESDLEVINNAITNHNGPNAIFIDLTSDASFTYNNFYGNSGDNFAGTIPAGAGVVTTVNANGHPSDTYYNIFENPEYINQAIRDYNLSFNSALIDAGDPTSSLDPDGTVVDIGAFYYAQGAPELHVTLTINDPPVLIPPEGDTITYNISIENSGSNPVTFDVWTALTLPDGTIVSPIIQRPDITLYPSVSVTREDIPQYVSGDAPAGEYTYTAYTGTYPNTVIASDSFTFEKLAGLDGSLLSNRGLQVSEREKDFKLSPPSPNPFNPTTTLNFALPSEGFVQLSVYDISGRHITELVDGWRNAGDHQVTFDASGLVSGVYIYRLITQNHSAVGKMILTK